MQDKLQNTMRKKQFLFVAVILGAIAAVVVYANLQVGATQLDQQMAMDGDDLIPHPIGIVNHAITIDRAPRDVWPWLAQMGSGRAGWYGYDFIDNGGRHSSDRILPAYQKIAPGSIMPALPGVKDVFVVVRCEPERSLVLAWQLPDGHYQTTWAFVLTQPKLGQTRLIVRGRVGQGYRPFGLPQWVALLIGRPAHFIMERKQLLGIAERAESNR